VTRNYKINLSSSGAKEINSSFEMIFTYLKASLGKRFSSAPSHHEGGGSKFSLLKNSTNKPTTPQQTVAVGNRSNTTEQPQSYSHTETAV